MIRKIILGVTLAVAMLPGHPPSAQTRGAERPVKANLTVTLTGVRNDKGQVFIQLWNAPEGYPKQGEKSYKSVAIEANTAVQGVVTAVFSDLTPGTYAVSTLHDENRNGKMDTNFIGMPTEGWAVSNNVVTHTHAPSYEQASFQVPAAGTQIAIALHY
jgi:uncharacterized protein (DUF2141 family)